MNYEEHIPTVRVHYQYMHVFFKCTQKEVVFEYLFF
jgi:hypothetical protein